MQQQDDLGDADAEQMGLDSDSDSDSDDDEGPSLRERRQRWRAWDEEYQRRSHSGNEDGKRKKRRAERPGTRQPRRDGARLGYGSQQVRLAVLNMPLTSYKSTAARVTFCRHGAWSLLAVRGETCSTT